MTDFSALPDAEKYPPSSKVTPAQISTSGEKLLALRGSTASREEIDAAEAAHQDLCNAQTEELRSKALQAEVSRLLK
jgi:hypothetical protein